MSSRRPLFICLAGVGLGNATRCFAIVEQLEHEDIHILSFGKGADFFNERGYLVHRLLPMVLPKRTVDYLWAVPFNVVLFLLNMLMSMIWVLRYRPRLMLFDSEYSAILPGLLFVKQCVGLNNAAVVKALWAKYGGPELRLTYWTREVWDAWICGVFDVTIVPTFNRDLELPERRVAIPPIVRTLPQPQAVESALPLVLRGGSTHVTPVQNRTDIRVDEVGGHNCVDDSMERILKAPVVVCQGGFSSLSEVLAMGKVAIAAPLPGHAEQVINVRWLVDQGAVLELGSDEDLVDALKRARDFNPTEPEWSFDGAEIAAKIINERLGLDAAEPVKASRTTPPR